MELKTRPLCKSFGLEIQGVDLANLDDATFDAIYKLWQKEPILLFCRQSLTESEQVAYSRRFGVLDHLVRDDMYSPKHPEIIYVTALMKPNGRPLGGLGAYELLWHHDQIYRERPASGSILYGCDMPEGDGLTSYCNTQLGLECMPADMREKIAGKKAVAKYGYKKGYGIEKDFEKDKDRLKVLHDRTPPQPHDTIMTDPVTGRETLYMDPNKTVTIDGMDEAETQAFLEDFKTHMLQDRFIYTHSWRNGDVLHWDNARVWHKRGSFDENLPRLAKRTTIFLNPADFAVPEPQLFYAAAQAKSA
ncbi:MAG: TauD/TfdA family dioxygenase [Rhodospirillaceae bacterium]